jgi:interleukin enhancer-binding factor 2
MVIKFLSLAKSKVQGFSSKVITVIENMILTGEGEQLTLEEVRLVGSQKKGTGLHDSVTADIVTLFKDVPKESVVIELAFKVKNIIETAAASTDQPLTVQLNGKWFDMINYDGAIVRVFSSSTGDIIYGAIDELPREDFNVYTNALRMIRHTRWWDEHTESLKNVRSLVRIIKSMRGHVPGLAHLNVWYIELLCHCSLIPLNGAEPLSLLDGFRRLFELLAAGLFLPGSIGLPDPCEEGDDAIHENLLPVQCEELTSHAQRILVLLQFGAYREVLACDGCSPAKFSVPYSFGELTLDVSPPAYLTALNID